MAQISFTKNLLRHVDCPSMEVMAGTVQEMLAITFETNPRLSGYLLDDQGCLRRHMNIFVDGTMIRDREKLSDTLSPSSKVLIIQALSGG